MIPQRKHYACFYHITRLKMILHLIVDSLQVKEEPVGNGCDNYNEVTDPLAIEEILIKSEDHVIKNEVESEILLNDDVSSQPNLNMRTNEQINDLRTMETEEEVGFYQGHVAMYKGTIKGSTKNFITCKSINNSLNDGIINENSSECDCAYGDVTIENLIENISSENKLLEQKGKKFVCEYCNERFRCSCSLKRHINICTKQKKNISNFCQKSFNYENVLKRHFNNINTTEENHVCNVCQKSFNSKSHLVRHLNIHTKEKNYICNFCQKSFNDKSCLNKHINIHTKEKKYICNFCQKSFYDISILKLHLNTHTKEKNYICNFCQKCFYQISNLKSHLNIHTKEKNYICNLCQKSFSYRSNLKRHLKIHTKEKN
ncbi:uncharacterized protein LOC142319646 isoform X2 [Lycorma delicatula]|uniref:uncharacterized protein LOC142319646 isoform X2 n=1 Tax=Lycorma delicatula TaxID=130591 RepID=UPI003F5119FF